MNIAILVVDRRETSDERRVIKHFSSSKRAVILEAKRRGSSEAFVIIRL
ncbi:MAG: hypothetical protein II565_13800 [Fibrobacter sp.]|nr:hypothetical protein [Fibrobacter sp.]MBQ5464565.1 hypothetical protein [Fibrobacter sp.]